MWLKPQPHYDHKKMYVDARDRDVPPVVYYPPGFDITGGCGNRVSYLNSCLLTQYAILGQTLRYRYLKTLKYNEWLDANPQKIPIKDFMLDRMASDLNAACDTIKNAVQAMRNYIKEIDAVSGPQGYYIPQEFERFLYPLELQVESKSLRHLAEPPYYVDEIAVEGQIQLLASYVNRVKYFDACSCEEMKKCCEEMLKSTYYSLNPDIFNSMPSQLRDKAREILRSMWSQKKADALDEINDNISDSDEEILCLSDSELETLKQEFIGQYALERQSEKSNREFASELDEDSKKRSPKELKKLNEVTGPSEKQDKDLQPQVVEDDQVAKEKEHDKQIYQMQKEQQVKKVIKDKNNEASEKKQGIGKYQVHRLVGDEDEEGEEDEDEEGDCYDDDYPFDTQDSNAEDNPQYDYPDEESSDSEDKLDEYDYHQEPMDDEPMDDEDDQSD